MNWSPLHRMRYPWAALILFLIAAAGRRSADGADVFLKNGMQFSGQVAPLRDLGANPLAIRTRPQAHVILLIDDGLRRTYVPHNQVDSVASDVPEPEGIPIPHDPVALKGHAVSSVGSILATEPFDRWGRRRVRLSAPQGEIVVVQGITEISPVYTKVEGLATERSFVWDCRIATSSIPRTMLSQILIGAIDEQDATERLGIVRLYIQAQRYEEAIEELNRAIADFADLADLKQQQRELNQLRARRLLRELKLRRQSGQHLLVRGLLSKFPTEDVPLQILEEVSQIQQQYAELDEQLKTVKQQLQQQVSQLKSDPLLLRAKPIVAEMVHDLNYGNLDRMADYIRLKDEKAPPERNLAYAVSGWLLGPGEATANEEIAFSLVEVRNLIRKYLATEADDGATRSTILEELRGLEGSEPTYVAKLLASMVPPLHAELVEQLANQDNEGSPAAGDANRRLRLVDKSGLIHVRVPGVERGEEIEYLVQLPPAYDPYRRYPTVVTLHGAASNPEMQIDWWAGSHDSRQQSRLGQAGRHGYIVIAPYWADKKQRRYGYSAREHANVLFSLSDACSRFSVDTERVFLSGHSMGGDAAWDMALAHPDRWAGAIPIVAVASYTSRDAPEYVLHYSDNARHIPLYFVNGDKDGDKMQRNSRQFERYLSKPRCDTVVVEYRGRGHEHFQDEIHRLFQWMALHRREPFPREFECSSMRELDSFFWWSEMYQLPSRSMVSPFQWPKPRTARPVKISGKFVDGNTIWLNSGATHSIIWLTPEIVDFNSPITAYFDRQRIKQSVSPSTEVMLEDARTRCDRLHPFWAKIESERTPRSRG